MPHLEPETCVTIQQLVGKSAECMQIENDRLYNIIQSLQKSGTALDVDRRVGGGLGSDAGSVGTSDGSAERQVS